MVRQQRCSTGILLGLTLLAVAVSPAHADPLTDPIDESRIVDRDRGGPGPLAVVDFESIDLPAGSITTVGDGLSFDVDGFRFTPGPNNASGFNDSHYGNAISFWGYNGTHVGGYHDDVVITRESGLPFDLVSLDLSGFPLNSEVAFTVTGQPGGVVANFVPDGQCDGLGGIEDFETFVLPGSFQGLTSVTVEHSGAGTNGGVFHLDNLVVSEVVSVDRTPWGRIKAIYR